MKIDNKIKQTVLNKTFRKRHITPKMIDNATDNINLIQFFIWWDENKVDYINNKFCLRFENKYKIFEDGVLCFYTGEWFFPINAVMEFLQLDFQQAFYALNYFSLRVCKAEINAYIQNAYADENNNLTVDAAVPSSEIDLQAFLDNDLLLSTEPKVKETALKRIYAYLGKTRGIHRDVISHFIKRRLIAVDDKYNLNFITYKEDKVIAVTRRSTNTYQRFQQNYVAESRTGFLYQSKLATELKTLYVFESCIDLMSYLSLVIEKKVDKPDKRSTCYISLNGANIKYISKILADNPSIENVVMCLDNDDFGIRTTETFMKTSIQNTTTFQPVLREMTSRTGILVKDINDYLIQSHKYEWQGEDEYDIRKTTISDGTPDSNYSPD